MLCAVGYRLNEINDGTCVHVDHRQSPSEMYAKRVHARIPPRPESATCDRNKISLLR